jgi:hypothetical protein
MLGLLSCQVQATAHEFALRLRGLENESYIGPGGGGVWVSSRFPHRRVLMNGE